jgi:hypothetical protein
METIDFSSVDSDVLQLLGRLTACSGNPDCKKMLRAIEVLVLFPTSELPGGYCAYKLVRVLAIHRLRLAVNFTIGPQSSCPLVCGNINFYIENAGFSI